jgi:hypothetical protein
MRLPQTALHPLVPGSHCAGLHAAVGTPAPIALVTTHASPAAHNVSLSRLPSVHVRTARVDAQVDDPATQAPAHWPAPVHWVPDGQVVCSKPLPSDLHRSEVPRSRHAPAPGLHDVLTLGLQVPSSHAVP